MTALLMRGIAVGAFAVTALSVGRSELSRDAKLTTALTCLSAAAWTLTGAEQSLMPFGRPYPLVLLGFPAAGFFWAFVACVFQDRLLRPSAFAPAGLLLLLGVGMTLAPPGFHAPLAAAFNIAAAGLCLHAVFLILRSWRDDLVDSRRSSRVVILGVAALLAVVQGAAGALHGLGRGGPWAVFALGDDFGAITISVLAVAMGGLFVQTRVELFAQPVRGESVDPRRAASDQILLTKLEALMDAGAWRREGLSIGGVARDLGVQEHRLRRLINAQLRYRNFADFVNGHRIRAAQVRLADPTEADTTIASIAFDLGFGSLSPFNRAFRASTGSTPSAWRRAAYETNALLEVD